MTRHLPARLAAVVTLVVVLALLAHVHAQKPASQAELLLGKALNLEDVAGNLKDAIATYEQVLKASDATRAQKARAQFRIGACYERLGTGEARKAYEAVVSQYGDQSELVAQARARIVALGGTESPTLPADAMVRRLWKTTGWIEADFSPDGRSVAFIDGLPGRLKVRDLSSGADRLLVDIPSGNPLSGMALDCRWSPDSSRIAFGWATDTGPDGTFEIRVVDVRSGSVSTYDATRKAGIWSPLDWSPDGRRVLVAVPKPQTTPLLYAPGWLSLDDGSIRLLDALTCPSGGCANAISPDGSRIAARTTLRTGSGQSGVVLANTNGSVVSPVLVGSEGATPVAWTPTGDGLILRSRRSGRDALYLLPVEGMRATGAPQLVWDNLGEVGLIGVSRTGVLLYRSGGSQDELQVATVDFASARAEDAGTIRATGGAAIVAVLSWSPDGRRLAYIARVGGRQALMIKTDGQARDQVYFFEFEPSPVASATWSPDGRSLFIFGSLLPAHSPSTIYRVDLASGGAEPLFPPVPVRTDDGGSTMYFATSSDGRFVYKQKMAAGTRVSSLWRQNVSDGTETELYRTAGPAGLFKGVPSPDGRWIPFWLNPFDGGEKEIMVLPLGGGTPRRLCPAGNAMTLAWSPDSQWLIFTDTKASSLTNAVTDVMEVPVAGGEPRKLGIQAARISGLAVHPDRSRVVYGRTTTTGEEVWLLENFLPPARTGPVKK